MAETPGLKCSLRAFVSSDSTMLVSYTDNANIDIGSGIRYKGIPQYATGLPIGFPATTTVQLQPLNSTDGFPLGNMSLAVNRSAESTYSYFFANHDDCTPGPFVQSFQLYDGKKLAVRVLPAYCALLVPPVWSSKNDVVRSIAAVTDGQCPQMNIDAIGDPRSHDFRQAYEISFLSPVALYLFTSTALSVHSTADRKPISKQMQVNVFTVGNGTILPYSDLTFHQRETSGRNMPVTADGIANLTSLLASSLDETSLLMDEAAQDCTTLTVFDFYVEDSATLLVINVVGIDVHKANMVLIADPSSR
ncbi:hypothetical protein GCK32_004252 [Trichostrongylus colubriformis]|uniref:Uncharacterized protein n=1 Tax=Trichostrongylus colubriformis TaxID=6319 RepID=A0AAN8FK61_TRICO